jgi:hypothetical protein
MPEPHTGLQDPMGKWIARYSGRVRLLAKLLHLVEDQRDRLLHTPVWILLIAVPGLHEAHRRADDKLPSRAFS